MKQFGYQRPSGTDEALRLASGQGTRFLAGGTNLVDLMKLGVETPDLLVDVTGLASTEITEHDGGLRVGAGARNSDLAVHPLVRRRYPALSQALLSGASGQLRNLATVGGNLLQRTRCPYFQDVTKPCNKRAPGTGCPAREGEHRNLAVLGASEHCVATHPSDMAVAMAAFDATVGIQDGDGSRNIPLADFYRPPGDSPDVETVLPAGALITHVDLPAAPPTSSYRKVRERASYAFAIGSLAAVLDQSDGTVRDIRLAFGAVAPMPWRARRAEEALRGTRISEDAVRAAMQRELEQARPLRDNGYKLELMTTIAVRELTRLAGGAS